MEKRYQVFVSSTFVDLKDERQAVMQALLSLDHFPAGMELFPASDDDQWTLIKGVIDDSDYYIIVVGGRYGSTDDTGLGYTEKEFDYAVHQNKPVLAFLHEKPEELAVSRTDASDQLREKLTRFRKKIQTGRVIKYWINPDDLKAKVIQSITAETKRNPQQGWVRAGNIADPLKIEELRQEIDRLKDELNKSRVTPPQGAEQYKGGRDEFKVNLLYRSYSYEAYTWTEDSFTWDRIFYEVGPILMDEASEAQMKKQLGGELIRYTKEWDDLSGEEEFQIDEDSFQTIKVQLVALGYIQKSAKKHGINDVNTYWTLTGFGETYLMRLRAIRK